MTKEADAFGSLAVDMMKTRKFIQLINQANIGWGNSVLLGLCDDGTVWFLDSKRIQVDENTVDYDVNWVQLPSAPTGPSRNFDEEDEVIEDNPKRSTGDPITPKDGYRIKYE